MSELRDSDREIVRLDNVGKVVEGNAAVVPLKSISLSIEYGDFVAVVGPSGAGKSTILNILGLLDEPTMGRYLLNGLDTSFHTPRQRARLRASFFGFVFQAYHLLEHRSVIDNVMVGMLYRGWSVRERWARAVGALDAVGLVARSLETPRALSGGERQRIAIARALAGRPRVLLCDEPTGNLDSETGGRILDLFERLNEDGLTLVVVTHDEDVANRAQRTISVVDGFVRKS